MIAELIRRRKEIITPEIQHVIFCYMEYQPEMFDALKKELMHEIEFVKGLDFDIPEGNTRPTLLILDDCMQEVAGAKEICAMFTRGKYTRTHFFQNSDFILFSFTLMF